MKRALVASVVLLFVASYAGAAVIDGFEGGAAWVSNYTISGTGGTPTLTSAAVGGSAGEAPFAGSYLGVPAPSGQQKNSYVWNGPQQVSSGDSVSVMAYVTGDSYGGLSLIVKKLGATSEAYLATLYVYSTEVGMSAGATNLAVAPGGTPIKNWGTSASQYLGAAENHSAKVGNTSFGNIAGAWFRLEADYSEVAGVSNTVDFRVYNAVGGLLGSLQYVDTGSAGTGNQGAGSFGFMSQPWNHLNDVDDLGYVPEPATMGLLAVGGVLALLRRRR